MNNNNKKNMVRLCVFPPREVFGKTHWVFESKIFGRHTLRQNSFETKPKWIRGLILMFKCCLIISVERLFIKYKKNKPCLFTPLLLKMFLITVTLEGSHLDMSIFLSCQLSHLNTQWRIFLRISEIASILILLLHLSLSKKLCYA